MSEIVAPKKPHRRSGALACVRCRIRKVRCDHNMPCSNCVKADEICTPSTRVRNRRKYRTKGYLQERLARCEELLQKFSDGIGTEQQTRGVTEQSAGDDTDEAYLSEVSSSQDGEHGKREHAYELIDDDGISRFTDSYIWATLYTELRAMRELVETDDADDSNSLDSESILSSHGLGLIRGGDLSAPSSEHYLPSSTHVFKLWQIFLDRVNPLFKVVHAPTIQPIIIKGATSLTSLPQCHQALILAMYATVTLSLTEQESIDLLGMPRDSAIQSFLGGARTALMQFNFLKNYSMFALQALVLFVHCLQGRCDRHAAYILCGAIVRIALKMGYHRDGEILQLDPYETEMRRRLWWQIMIQDSKYAMLSGVTRSYQPFFWDTKLPSNINDADIFPGCSGAIKGREGPTEMAFVLVLTEIHHFKISIDKRNYGAEFEAVILGEMQLDDETSNTRYNATLAALQRQIDSLDKRLEAIERCYIDENAGNAHKAAKAIRQMLRARTADMTLPFYDQPEYGSEIFGPRDVLFKMMVLEIEQRIDEYEFMGKCGFLWFFKPYFQYDILPVITAQLCQRPSGSLVERAWDGIEKLYAYHTDLLDGLQSEHVSQGKAVSRAWKVREEAFRQTGQHLQKPQFILCLQELVAKDTETMSNTVPSVSNQDDEIQVAALLQGQYSLPSLQSSDRQHHQQQQRMTLPISMEEVFGTAGMNWETVRHLVNGPDYRPSDVVFGGEFDGI